MDEPYEKYDLGNHVLEIHQDSDPENNPRKDFDGNITTMVCFHKRYNLGDLHGYNKNHYQSEGRLFYG